MTNGIIDSGQKIVTNGLLLNLDAAQLRSYPTTGTNWSDLSGNGYNGTLTNGPTFNSANGGNIVFDGANDYVVSNLSKTNLGSQFTLNFWMYPTGAQTTRGILQFGNSLNSNTPFILLQRNTSTTVRWYLNADYRINLTILDNTYTNLCLTYNGTTWTPYVNGSQVGTPYVGAIGVNAGNLFYLGNGFGGYFSGRISQTIVYNRALTSTEVLQNFNANRSRYGL